MSMRLRVGRGIPPREVHRELFDWIPSEDQRTNERCMSWGTLDATLRFLGVLDWWEAKRAWCKHNRSTHFEIIESDALLIEQALLAFRAANPGVPVRFMSDEEDRALPYTYDDYCGSPEILLESEGKTLDAVLLDLASQLRANAMTSGDDRRYISVTKLLATE